MPVPEKRATVRLVGQDGNAFSILARCMSAGRKAGYTKDQLTEFHKEATSGDYDHLLCVVTEWFNDESFKDYDYPDDDESCAECDTYLDDYGDCPECNGG